MTRAHAIAEMLRKRIAELARMAAHPSLVPGYAERPEEGRAEYARGWVLSAIADIERINAVLMEQLALDDHERRQEWRVS